MLAAATAAVMGLAVLAGCSGGRPGEGATTVAPAPTTLGASTTSPSQSPTTPITAPTEPTTASSSSRAHIRRRADGALPDPKFTPGSSIPGVSESEICEPDWNAEHKDISYDVQNKVSSAYGVIGGPGTNLRLDQLIPASLGGTADVSNVWPQPTGNDDTPGYEEKNGLDARLHQLVCQGQLSLSTAQEAETSSWTDALAEYGTAG